MDMFRLVLVHMNYRAPEYLRKEFKSNREQGLCTTDGDMISCEKKSKNRLGKEIFQAAQDWNNLPEA